MLPARDSWPVNTAHVSSFVLISILRGQPRTPPSGKDLGVLDYDLNEDSYSVKRLSGSLTHTTLLFIEMNAKSYHNAIDNR